MKIRVLLLHNILWSHYKGVVFSNLYNQIDKNEIDLRIVQIALTEKQRKTLGDVDLSCHAYPYKLLFNSSFEEIPPVKRIIAIAKELNSYDIIIIPGYYNIIFWFAWLISLIRGKKIIVSFDSTEVDHPHVWYKELWKRLFISGCTAAFCYGKKSEEYLLKLGMNPEDIYQRCQATDNDKIKLLHKEAHSKRDELVKKYSVSKYNFVYVGRVSKEKNIDVLLSAFGNLKMESVSSEWGLIVVGDGPERPHLEQTVSEMNIRDVYFTGGQSWTDVVSFYALGNVFVLPSLSEPWGLVVNEAMVCGLPVIVSNRCGAAYDLVMDGENGFIFDPENIDDLYARLLFVRNPQELARMGVKSDEIISQYNPRHAAEQMLEGVQHIAAMLQ